MTKRGMFRERVDKRRAEATERQQARSERGDAGQLDRLDKLGYTAQRERMRLSMKLGPKAVEATGLKLWEVCEYN